MQWHHTEPHESGKKRKEILMFIVVVLCVISAHMLLVLFCAELLGSWSGLCGHHVLTFSVTTVLAV